MLLDNKVAIITGGGSGIGTAIARRFSEEGASVLITGRRPEPLEEVSKATGAAVAQGDTADPDHAAAVVAQASEQFGGLDIVVANAGIGLGGSAGEVSDEAWNRTLDVNLTGPLMLCRSAIPALMARGGGSIVLVSSVSAFLAAPESSAYEASKAALIALARSIAVDYGDRGIRANAMCPGWVRTPMGDSSMDELAEDKGISREDAYALSQRLIPLRRAAEPEEIAACCLFLASDESSYVTGAALVADGGTMAVDPASVAWRRDG